MSAPIQRVGIVGAGAMGAMYASFLARAGFDVRFVARGDRARRLDAGLTVNGETLTVPVVDTDRPDEWTAELLLFAVKNAHLEQSLAEAEPVVAPTTIVLSVLNGLDSEERIAARLGEGPTVLLCVALAMDAERTGDTVTFRQAGRLVFGQARNDEVSPAVAAVQEALTRAGLDWETPPDMRHRMWWKFMVNVAVNQPSAVLDAPYGHFQHEVPARSLMQALIGEVIEVARAEAVALGPDDVAAWDRVLAGQPPEGRTSMHQDVLAGRPTEVDAFGGRVVALGAKHGIATPYNQTMVWILGRGTGPAD